MSKKIITHNNGIVETRETFYTEKTIQQLKQQLVEKDNLIEYSKEEIRKLNKRIDEIVERDKKLFDDKNKEIERLNDVNRRIHDSHNILYREYQNHSQLAVQGLEIVKTLIQNAIKFETDFAEVYNAINKQINVFKRREYAED